MKNVAIIHYMPLEFYPPVTNLLNCLVNHPVRIKVWSTKNPKKRSNYKHSKIDAIARSPFPGLKELVLVRLLKYLWFNFQCFFGLLIYRPDVVLYYESYSAFPVYLYYLIFGKQKRYFIHYHEYESPDNYSKGMILVKYYHQLEKRYLYPVAEWISQTNTDRLQLFQKDHPSLKDHQLHIMPNYPPESWWYKNREKEPAVNGIIKTVYVGALSIKDTYIKEYCEWVELQNGRVTFDIYSYNLHTDTLVYLKGLNSPNIKFFEEGIDYNNLPSVLRDYNIGLILYKGNTPNYVYNAPNKLFEYLACGLKVIYPEVMLGIKPYNSDVVQSVSFLRLPTIDFLMSLNQFEIPQNNNYTAEGAYKKLINRIILD
ncbi:glycosyltransferase family 4 protein [Paucihalobacter ruber]|uniref:Glycosyltransferase family 4 protein n=1 Tax=Paucihalobacter ruber TaxID=2567861 RepID=A0A506PQ79_9FLAO|nr:glycosyltransferase family 4 protein [Paucihalobacter ruber]TPV35739.1 glycosyltransferase family 4 protein [Paucihalobacter ruber]